MINKKPKLSIIAAVYNLEKYLPRCLDALVNQTLEEIEILCVDDGSIDKSGEFCDRYSAEYSYINTVHIPNGGLSNARNTGLKYANGDYVRKCEDH